MAKICLKCGHERRIDDATPEYECPSCGVIYSKYEEKLLREQQAREDRESDTNKPTVQYETDTQSNSKNERNRPLNISGKDSSKNPKLTQCKTCDKEVSLSSTTCPHCGEKNPALKLPRGCLPITGIFFGLVFIFEVFFHSNPDKFQAQADCESFVTKNLKAPSSAKFAPHSELTILQKGNGFWTVVGYVDSQNSFGAMIRSRFICSVHYDKKNVFLDSIQIN
jgi:predicted RNA-binding Zn-ribbon protein involved in translation (DUF1610 family)